MTLRRGLAKSKNMISIQILNSIGARSPVPSAAQGIAPARSGTPSAIARLPEDLAANPPPKPSVQKPLSK